MVKGSHLLRSKADSASASGKQRLEVNLLKTAAGYSCSRQKSTRLGESGADYQTFSLTIDICFIVICACDKYKCANARPRTQKRDCGVARPHTRRDQAPARL